jgi:hypothetical protein
MFIGGRDYSNTVNEIKGIKGKLEITTWDDTTFEYRERGILAVNIMMIPTYSSSSSCSRSSNFMNRTMAS